MPCRTGCSARPLADGVHGDRRAARTQRRRPRKVIQTGHDERTLLRFSRISIARCADLIRSPASAWGPLSRSVHPVTGSACQGPTSPRTGPSAGQRRQYGRIAAAGEGDANWSSWWSGLLMPMTCCPGTWHGQWVVSPALPGRSLSGALKTSADPDSCRGRGIVPVTRLVTFSAGSSRGHHNSRMAFGPTAMTGFPASGQALTRSSGEGSSSTRWRALLSSVEISSFPVRLREPLAGTTVQTFPGIPGHFRAWFPQVKCMKPAL